VHDIQKKVVVYNIINKNLKEVAYFGMIQNYDKFSRWNQNLAEFTHFEKFIFIQQLLTQNMWSIGATMCIFINKLQKISFKNSFIWKSEKWLKKTHNPFVK
jgi:hypothetical protein